MPFDGSTYKTKFDFATATPDERLIELARLLENEQEWRNKLIVWNFEQVLDAEENVCGSVGCALGLAQKKWGQFVPDESAICGIWKAACNWFDLDWKNGTGGDDEKLFGRRLAKSLGKHEAEVTPGDVATAIRKFVAQRNPSLS